MHEQEAPGKKMTVSVDVQAWWGLIRPVSLIDALT